MNHLNKTRQGFTLVEIMIVVGVIGLLAMLAIPSMMKARHESRKSAFINDIRIVAGAFQIYNFNTGKYPADTGPGIEPPEIADYLPRFEWAKDTVVGGQWEWDYGAGGVTAGVSITGATWSDADMTVIDASIDDGNLTSGIFKKNLTKFTYILE